MRCAVLLMFAAVMCTSCRTENDVAAESAFTDAAIPEWVVDSVAVIRIGDSAIDGYWFDRVSGAQLIDDRLVVGDAASRQLRFYGLDGALVGTVGRSGAGPGEFGAVTAIARQGESGIAVWDRQLGRLSIFNARGALIRMIKPDVAAAGRIPVRFVGLFPDGTSVFRRELDILTDGTAARGEARDSASYLFFDPSGNFTGIVVRRNGDEKWLAVSPGARRFMDIMFGRRNLAVVAGRSLVVGSTDSLALETINVGGVVERRQALPWHSAAVSAVELELERDRLIAAMRKESTSAVIYAGGVMVDGRPMPQLISELGRQAIEDVPYRSIKPAFGELRGGVGGEIWVGQHLPHHSAPQSWVILDSELEPIGRLRTSASGTILDIGKDLVVTLSRDNLDREIIALHRLRHR